MIIIVKLRSYGQKSNNTTRNSENERQINVFLRTEDIDLINVINEETLLQQPEERFAWLRSKIGSDKTFLSSAPFAVMIGRLLSNY